MVPKLYGWNTLLYRDLPTIQIQRRRIHRAWLWTMYWIPPLFQKYSKIKTAVGSWISCSFCRYKMIEQRPREHCRCWTDSWLSPTIIIDKGNCQKNSHWIFRSCHRHWFYRLQRILPSVSGYFGARMICTLFFTWWISRALFMCCSDIENNDSKLMSG